MQGKSDEELLNYWGSRKQKKAFNVLYERYGHYAYGCLFKYVKLENDCNDLAAEVWIQIWDGLPENIQNFKSYLFFICRNKAFAHLKSIRKTNTLEEKELIDLRAESDPLPAPIKEVAYCVGTLKEEQKLCLQMFFYQNMSYKEIEEESSWTMKQIKSLLQNGKRMLKLCLEERIKS